MRVFNTFFKIIKYYFPMISIYLVLFIVITLVFTNLTDSNVTAGFTDERINIAVFDKDDSVLSESIVSLLVDKHNVKEIEDDPQAITDALYNRNVEYIVTIPENFETNFTNSDAIPKLKTQSVPNTYSTMYVSRLLDSYLNTLKAYFVAGADFNNAIANSLADMDISANVEYKDNHAEEREPVFFFFTYMPYAILMISILGIGVALLAFFRKQLDMRTSASSISLSKKNSELGLSMGIMALGLIAIFLIFGMILYGTSMLRSGSLICLLNLLCFTIFAIALAFLIGVLARNINVLNGAANALGLAMCFLGGIFIPREVMGDSVLNIAKFVPTYWYSNVIEKISYGNGLDAKISGSIAIDMLIQILFAAALFAVAMVITKQKRFV